MKILIPTIGSRGDVQPFIALSQGLARAGHDVVLASHPVMRSLIESYQIPFHPIGPDIDMAKEAAEILQASGSPAAGLMRVMGLSFDVLRQAHDDILARGRDTDLIVISAQSAAGKNEADLLGVPYLSVTLMPWAIPWDDPERSFWRRSAYGLIDQFAHMLTTRPLNHMRKELGLPPAGREGFTSLQLNLVPVSPAVFQPIRFWEPRHRMVGYWFVEEPGGWEPPVDLIEFLSKDPPPLVISLGSMGFTDSDTQSTLEQFLQGVQQAGVRAVIQGYKEVAERISLPDTILITGSVPHHWLLPKCSAIVHHGGFGTTAAGLRAGIPALVIPHIADQFYWGKIIHELGAGPEPIPRRKLIVEKLAASLIKLNDNKAYTQSARALGEQIGSEKGIGSAVRQIEAVFG